MTKRNHANAERAAFWESSLTSYLLSSDGPFGSAPLTTIDPSPAELARAVGKDPGDESASQDFVDCLRNDPGLVPALEDGDLSVAWSTIPGTPGFVRYLVLTCLIPYRLESDTNNFRARLGELLGTDRSFSRLEGVARLWSRLANWSSAQRRNGLRFRRIQLPDPGIQNHIGHSLRISFPTWRERKRMERLLRHVETTEFDDPQSVVARLRPRWVRGDLGAQIEPHFRDFQRRWEAGDRLLHEHRLWKLVQSVADQGSRANSRTFRALEIRVDVDDGEMSFLVIEGHEGEAVETESFVDASARLRGLDPAFARSHDQGVIVLQEHGWLRWRSCDLSRIEPDRGVMLALDGRHRSVAVNPTPIPPRGQWVLTSSMTSTAALNVLRRLRLSASCREAFGKVELVDEVRMGSVLLGRATYLPGIRSTSRSRVRIEGITEDAATVTLHRRDDGVWILASREPLQGRYEVVVTESNTEEATIRSVVFDARALIAEVSRPAPSTGHHAEAELVVDRRNSVQSLDAPAPKETDVEPRLVDLGEALQARAIRGCGEQELVSLIRRAAGSDGPPAWDILRMLAEAGWLRPFVRDRWRARRWFLQPPVLLQRLDESRSADVAGAISLGQSERLSSAAAAVDARIEHRLGKSAWMLPVIRVHGDIEGISERTGWEIRRQEAAGLDPAPDCWVVDARDAGRRQLKDAWSWTDGRFRLGSNRVESGTILRRWWREDDRDLYQVVSPGGSTRYFESRGCAILEAHRLEGRPLFIAEDGYCNRAAAEGHMPLEIAHWIRCRTGRPSGPVFADGLWSYAYPHDPVIEHELLRVLGGAVRGTAREVPQSSPLADALRRHRTPRYRQMLRTIAGS